MNEEELAEATASARAATVADLMRNPAVRRSIAHRCPLGWRPSDPIGDFDDPDDDKLDIRHSELWWWLWYKLEEVEDVIARVWKRKGSKRARS